MVVRQKDNGSSPRERSISTNSVMKSGSLASTGSGSQCGSNRHSASQTPIAAAHPPSSINERQTNAGTSPLLSVLRELSIGALGEYIGATSQLTMSRIISSMTVSPQEAKSLSLEEDGAARPSESSSWENLSPKSANTLSKTDIMLVDLAQIPPDIANKLLDGYIAHISTRWPVMHTPYIRHLHENRSSLTDVYEYVLNSC